jgi:hypothetical protein
VRAIFKQAANGQTPAEIAKRVNHLGWRTKQWKAKRSGQVCGGGKWTPRQVVSLLHNPAYLGQFVDGERHDRVATRRSWMRMDFRQCRTGLPSAGPLRTNRANGTSSHSAAR